MPDEEDEGEPSNAREEWLQTIAFQSPKWFTKNAESIKALSFPVYQIPNTVTEPHSPFYKAANSALS